VKVTQLNHVAVHVADLEASHRFYEQVLGLSRIPRPAFDFPGTWYRLGHDQELHLIARPVEGDATPRERHFALKVNDLDAFASHLERQGVAYRGPSPRPDGARQVFVRDPDGHVIELCALPDAP
jgi:catechol 2,3-dioxygenase-like lactoylglutathione lyase family enzyme